MKLEEKLDSLKYAGYFLKEEAAARAMRLIIGEAGDAAGNRLALYWLVDEEDGVIADAKFQVFGPPHLIGAAEIACELLLRKNYDQACRLTAELLDRQARDKPDLPAFPQEAASLLNLVLSAIDAAAEQCFDIPIADVYTAPPISPDAAQESVIYPGWDLLDIPQKIAVIEGIIASDIRPYIELDAGGVQILNLNGTELIIAYQGSCTSCYSATGATLNAIQQILRTKVHPELTVVPDLSLLSQ